MAKTSDEFAKLARQSIRHPEGIVFALLAIAAAIKESRANSA